MVNAPLRVLFAVFLLSLLAPCLQAQYPAACDGRKDCVFNGVSLTETAGRGAHFIEIDQQPFAPRQTAMTVELWAKIGRQAGRYQFLGGLWGPLQDYNDVWVLAIDEADNLVFEVNGDGTRLGSVDNTVVRSPFTGYDRWTHVAAVFDGATQTASLVVDGVTVATARNATYPTSYLKPLERGDLTAHIGSCNALADDQNRYRTLLGMVDEVRIWSRALPSQELLCNKDRSLNGNEAGLTIYYRCNEAVNNVVQICDATGRGHTGLLRSGASNQRSDRAPPRTTTVIPANITDVITCDQTKSWTVTITDAAPCGTTMSARMRGPEAGLFTLSQANLTLLPGQPVTMTVTYTGTNVGQFVDTLELRPANRCGLPNTLVVFTITRNTELSYSRGSIVFDTLYVGCVDQTSIDSTVVICNTSDKLGTPRTVTISSFRTNDPSSFRVISPTAPLQLAPGQCTTVVVRSFVRDTTNDYLDTLLVISDDRCQSVPGAIPLTGRTQEVISIRTTDGRGRVDTMSFSNTCPGQLSSPREYTWQNLTMTNLIVDSITVPPDFTHYRMAFPMVLTPETGYDPIAVRFRPRAPGNVLDSIIIHTRIQGCDIKRVIYVRGRGYDNRIQFSANGLVDVGDVVVGRQRTVSVTATNTSDIDTLTISLYVERGEAFTLLAGTSRRLAPRESVTIPVTFRPIDSLVYTDRLCLFETRCYTVDCIDLRGRGILETFRFSPLVMETENVVACGSQDDTVHIVNMTSAARTLTNVRFVDAAGRFTVVDPPLPWSTFTIAGSDSLRVIVRYTPNDLVNDRADRAFITYDHDGEEWQVQLIGTSATPRLFVTQNNVFGTVEVGDVRRQRLAIENTSSLPVRVDSVTVPAGFVIVSMSRTPPVMLQPRDSIVVELDFVPSAAQVYTGDVRAYSSNPCAIVGTGDVQGRGVIIELENALSLINFGYVRPCECTERFLPLLNASLVHDMTVDSIWIDSATITGGTPQYYTWRSTFSPNGVVPFTIPANTRDTVIVTYCPRSLADDRLLDCRAMLHVQARGSGWQKETQTYLAGKRALTFKPDPLVIQFPPENVDVLSATPRTVDLSIPGLVINPFQDAVTIDSITFEPNDRVFFVTAPAVFPVTVDPGDTLAIDVRQRPRAPRAYEARMVLHFSTPCRGFDSTVLVRGAGFAQTRGLAFTYDPQRVPVDTFAMYSCDTLVVPIHSSIVIDASVVDIGMRIDFDTTQLRLLDVQSPVTAGTCRSATGGLTYQPTVTVGPSAVGGYSVLCKNFCGVDSLQPFAYARFVTRQNNRVDSRVTIDSINFDTEDVILFRLVATGDDGVIIARKSEIDVQPAVSFDSVRVLDCVDRTVVIYNVGDVPNTVDDLLDLPSDVAIVAAVPPIGIDVQPGDSAVVTVRFCPSRDHRIDTAVIAVSRTPCATTDTTTVSGQGYAPDFPLTMMATRTYYVADSIVATMGDTITVPLMVEHDVAATYRGTRYWLNGLTFSVDVDHNPRALKFLGIQNPAKAGMTVTSVPGSIRLGVAGIDTLRAGVLAGLRFVVTVPDVSTSAITVRPSAMTIDSLAFLDVVVRDTTTPLTTLGSCDITVLQYASVAEPALTIQPQPVVDEATITIAMQETVPLSCVIVDGSGRVVRTLLDGSLTLPGGSYAIRFSAADLTAGVYYVRTVGGVFTGIKPMVVVR